MVEFNPYDKDFAHDPYPIYKQLRDEAPVYHCEPLNFWAPSRLQGLLERRRGDHRGFRRNGSPAHRQGSA